VVSLKAAAERYVRDVLPKKGQATQRLNIRELANLLEFFSDARESIESIKPIMVRQYLDWRAKQVRDEKIAANAERQKKGRKQMVMTGTEGHVPANREKALLSHIWNYARETGLTSLATPCAGIKGFKEAGRDAYIDDAIYSAVWDVAEPGLRDAMDLAYLSAQRKADVLKFSRSDLKDEQLTVVQNKTGKRLRVSVEGQLAAVIERINKRKVAGIALVRNDKGERMTEYMLRGRIRPREARGCGKISTSKSRRGSVPVPRLARKGRHGQRRKRRDGRGPGAARALDLGNDGTLRTASTRQAGEAYQIDFLRKRYRFAEIEIPAEKLEPACLLVLRAGIEPARLTAGDFKSPVSTNFTIGATQRSIMTQAAHSCHTDNNALQRTTSPPAHFAHHLRRIMHQLANVLAAPVLEPQHDGTEQPPRGQPCQHQHRARHHQHAQRGRRAVQHGQDTGGLEQRGPPAVQRHQQQRSQQRCRADRAGQAHQRFAPGARPHEQKSQRGGGRAGADGQRQQLDQRGSTEGGRIGNRHVGLAGGGGNKRMD
jgi:hypothetical protein